MTTPDLTIAELQAYRDAIVGEDYDAPKLLPIRITEQLITIMQREADSCSEMNKLLDKATEEMHKVLGYSTRFKHQTVAYQREMIAMAEAAIKIGNLSLATQLADTIRENEQLRGALMEASYTLEASGNRDAAKRIEKVLSNKELESD